MRTQFETLKISQDGCINRLQVIGFHGGVESKSTPALRRPIWANARGRMCLCVDDSVYLAEVEHARLEILMPLSVEVKWELGVSCKKPDDPIPGDGTRCGPWPVRLTWVIVIIGEREGKRIDALRRRTQNLRVFKFLSWFQVQLSTPGNCVSGYYERQGNLGVWYCSPEDAYSLRQTIAEEVRTALLYEQDGIVDLAWWLFCTATSREDFIMAVAGLRLGGYRHWKMLLDASIHGSRTGYDEALKLIPRFEALLDSTQRE